MASRKDQRREKKRRATAERTERAAQAMHAGQRRLARGHAQPEPEPTAQQRELEARFAKAHEQAQRERLARQQGAREREERGRLHRATEQARAAQHALTAAEEARRARAGLLQKELRPAEAPEPASEGGWRERLRRGFAKTREGLASGLGRILLGRKEIDPALLPDIEEVLLAADVGPLTTARLLRAVEQRLRRHELADGEALREALKAEIAALMERAQARLEQVGGADGDDLARHKPAVILFVGVNGTGKTTTIGKLAAQHAAQGKRVLLIAGDTFRAAAAEQLGRWAERTGATLFAKHAGADPSGVIYQGVQQGVAGGFDLVLCDTAGRLHTKTNLMEELKKVKRVMGGPLPGAPHAVWLVLDGNTGQNAIRQTRDFHAALGVTGLIVTKLDGTARGGVVIGIVNEFDLPIRYVGVGEGADDLRPFDPRAYVDSLF